VALFIGFMLSKHAAQVSHASLGTAVRLFASAARQFLVAHRHARAIGADIHDGHGTAAGFGLPLLPSLRRCSYPLDHALDLPGTGVNTTGLG